MVISDQGTAPCHHLCRQRIQRQVGFRGQPDLGTSVTRPACVRHLESPLGTLGRLFVANSFLVFTAPFASPILISFLKILCFKKPCPTCATVPNGGFCVPDSCPTEGVICRTAARDGIAATIDAPSTTLIAKKRATAAACGRQAEEAPWPPPLRQPADVAGWPQHRHVRHLPAGTLPNSPGTSYGSG